MQKRTDLDALVFDVGNVLLRFDPLSALRGQYDNPLATRLHEAVFCSPHWLEVDRSVLTPAEIQARMAQEAPDVARYIPAVFKLYETVCLPIEGSVARLQGLKQAGYKLYVLSNFGDGYFAKTRAQYPFFDIFDGLLISGEHRVVKPDPAIYLLLLHRFGLTAERTLFIDDRQDNIDGAATLGIRGMLFTHPEQLDPLLVP